MDLSWVNWGDVPTWVTAIGVVPTVIIAGWQVSASARQNKLTAEQEEDSLRPVVVAQIEEDPTDWHFLDFTLRNVGMGPAYNVEVTFKHRPEVSPFISDAPFWKANFVKTPIPIMGPGQVYKTLADVAQHRVKDKALKPDGRVVVEYDSVTGKHFRDEFGLNFEMLQGVLRKDAYGMHDAAKALKAISKKYTGQ